MEAEFGMIRYNNEMNWFELTYSGGITHSFDTAEAVVKLAFEVEMEVRADESMPSGKLIELLAASIFIGETLRDSEGVAFDKSPIPDATVRHITRKEIGAVLPDGWYIELQLNRYSAMWGEELSLPARGSLAAAISDIHTFLSASIKQASDDLLASFQAQIRLDEEEQLSMWSSSDSPKGAVD